MRYGILSDVHGNLPALRAAVEVLSREGVDGWLCAGDVVGYGPQPNECLELLGELDAVTVLGNCDLMLLDRIPDDSAGRLARDTIRWTRGVLREDLRARLARLPRTVTVPGVVMTHATLDSAERRLHEESEAAEQLRELEREHPEARFLVVGHTHRPWAYHQTEATVRVRAGAPVELGAAGRFLLNPGSVGQSRQPERVPRSRCLLLDVDRAEARFFEVAYDVAEARRMLQRFGLPYDCIHRSPRFLSRVRRRGLREWRKLRGQDVYITAAPAGAGSRKIW